MLWIVSGPSSVGKSTFLESQRCREITGLPMDAPELIAFEPGIESRSLDNTLFQYNLLGPATLFRRRQAAEARTWKGYFRRIFRRSTSSESDVATLRSAA